MRLNAVAGRVFDSLLPHFFFCALLFWRAGDESWASLWIYRWLVLGLLTLLYLVRPLQKVWGWGFVLPVLYFLGVSLYGLAGPPRFPGEHGAMQAGLRATAGMTLAAQVGLLFLALKADVERLKFPLVIVTLVLSTGVLVASHPHYEVPFLANPSMTGSFIAVVASLLWWPMTLLLSVPLLLMHNMTPLVALAVGWVLRIHGPRAWLLQTMLLTVGLFILFMPPHFWSDNGRFQVWELAYNWWDAQEPLVFFLGAGAGATPILVPLIQVQGHESITGTNFFMFFHNEFLQVLFEQGFIGLLCLLGLYSTALLRSWERLHLRAAIGAYGVVMCTNFPFRWPLHAMLGMILFVLAMGEKSDAGTQDLRL